MGSNGSAGVEQGAIGAMVGAVVTFVLQRVQLRASKRERAQVELEKRMRRLELNLERLIGTEEGKNNK